jgi:hypothetical protein
VTYVSLTQIQAIPPASGATGLVDVRVTNALGTSAIAQPGDLFLLGAPIVLGVTPVAGPESAPKGKTLASVQVNGLGFAGCTVQFDKTAGTGVTVNSDTSITVTPPSSKLPKTVDVTVTNSVGTSEVTPDDEYTYYSPAKRL